MSPEKAHAAVRKQPVDMEFRSQSSLYMRLPSGLRRYQTLCIRTAEQGGPVNQPGPVQGQPTLLAQVWPGTLEQQYPRQPANIAANAGQSRLHCIERRRVSLRGAEAQLGP